jgi:hypothetical protein
MGRTTISPATATVAERSHVVMAAAKHTAAAQYQGLSPVSAPVSDETDGS